MTNHTDDKGLIDELEPIGSTGPPHYFPVYGTKQIDQSKARPEQKVTVVKLSKKAMKNLKKNLNTSSGTSIEQTDDKELDKIAQQLIDLNNDGDDWNKENIKALIHQQVREARANEWLLIQRAIQNIDIEAQLNKQKIIQTRLKELKEENEK